LVGCNAALQTKTNYIVLVVRRVMYGRVVFGVLVRGVAKDACIGVCVGLRLRWEVRVGVRIGK
jgi:hypothetical protein